MVDDTVGGRFGKGAPKSDIEWQMFYAAQVPGADAYDLTVMELGKGGKFGKVLGGRFGKGNPKSDVEWQMHRAKQYPGPDTGHGGVFTEVTGLREHNGAAFSTGNAKTDLDWAMFHAKSKPGPGGHDVDRDLDAWTTHNALSMGQIRERMSKMKPGGTAGPHDMGGSRQHDGGRGAAPPSPFVLLAASRAAASGGGHGAGKRAGPRKAKRKKAKMKQRGAGAGAGAGGAATLSAAAALSAAPAAAIVQV